MVLIAFSLLFFVCTVDELSDIVNFSTPSVNLFLKPTVASDILTSIPGITIMLMLAIEQFCLFHSQKHTWIGSDDTADRHVC